jgi:F0F1-type ATP synthase epsilon subunit
MAKVFDVQVMAPSETLYGGGAISLKARGKEGSFEILADHTDFIAGLAHGDILIKDPDGKIHAITVCAPAFLRVLSGKVVILL